jgi:hypothetical protein
MSGEQSAEGREVDEDVEGSPRLYLLPSVHFRYRHFQIVIATYAGLVFGVLPVNAFEFKHWPALL